MKTTNKKCYKCNGGGSVLVVVRTQHGKDVDGDVCPVCNDTGVIPTNKGEIK